MTPYSLPKADVSAQRFQKFLRDFAAYEAQWQKQTAQDRFLDAYSIWLRHRSPVTTENLQQAILALRLLDSTFQFPLPMVREAS